MSESISNSIEAKFKGAITNCLLSEANVEYFEQEEIDGYCKRREPPTKAFHPRRANLYIFLLTINDNY